MTKIKEQIWQIIFFILGYVSPKMLAAGHTIRDFVREDVQALIRDSAEALRGCTTAEDVSRLAASLVDRALAATLESPRGASAHDHVRGSRRAEKDVAPSTRFVSATLPAVTVPAQFAPFAK